jgi:hypothetical protein
MYKHVFTADEICHEYRVNVAQSGIFLYAVVRIIIY